MTCSRPQRLVAKEKSFRSPNVWCHQATWREAGMMCRRPWGYEIWVRFTWPPCSVALRRYCIFTNGRQDPPPARLQLSLLRYSLHRSGLELNPQYPEARLYRRSRVTRGGILHLLTAAKASTGFWWHEEPSKSSLPLTFWRRLPCWKSMVGSPASEQSATPDRQELWRFPKELLQGSG